MKALALIALSGCAVALPAAEADTAPAPASAAVAAAAPERVDVPGGPLSRDARTCDAAADHCLRPETWFLEKQVGKMRGLDTAFWAEGAWRDWGSGLVVEGGPGHRTKPAAFADLRVGDQVILVSQAPTSESLAHTANWRLETVSSIDAENQTFTWGNQRRGISIDLVRVIVETR